MIKVLFVCLGNICRSPKAEFIFKDMIKKHGIEDRFYVRSAATSNEEKGNPVYPPAKKKLAENGIGCDGKTAVKMTAEDYKNYDYIIAMEKRNVENIMKITGGDPDGKIRLLLDYTDRKGDISDPWFTRDFDRAYNDILDGVTGFLKFLKQGRLYE